ncbi:hypothetical protein [Paraburkholderia pallida]|uniref:hypothetical protein n=1 Tax=Paraburkholderia pallida TaxID=2547399 RepID=UPI0018D88600|nr:hypothetical protein [Paraburkholderia pallida]
MTLSTAISTPCPLPRQRGDAEERPRLSLAGAVPAQPAHVKDNGDGLLPSIQKNEAPSDRRGNLSRLEAFSIEIRSLAEAIVLGADIELLDLMRDEVGSYSRHKAAQEARTWAEQGRLSIETGLMQLERAMRSATNRG